MIDDWFTWTLVWKLLVLAAGLALIYGVGKDL